MKKSRPWAAMFAVVVLAALVVLSGCQGAIGKAGEEGDAGPAGPAGTPGTPSTTDNAAPTAKAIETQYLVLGGLKTRPATPAKPTAGAAAGNYGSVVIDLDDFFTDAEAPSLTYKAVSSDKKIASVGTSATTNLVTGSKLTVTAAGVGTVAAATSATATVTVEAYDGVNAPVEASFDVVVVTSNSPPTATGVDPIKDLVDKAESTTTDVPPVVVPATKNKLFKAAGTITRTFKATINPGSIGTEEEALTLRSIVGSGKAADAVASVTDPVKVGINTYSVDITALKAPSAFDTLVTVKIFAMDSFGAEKEVTKFDVVVNTPPSIFNDLDDVVLYRGANDAVLNDARIWTSAVAYQQVYYQLDDHFENLELDRITTAADAVPTAGDTTCTFSTSPKQPTGRPASLAAAEPPVIPIDAVTATTLASVSNGTSDGLRTILRDTFNDADPPRVGDRWRRKGGGELCRRTSCSRCQHECHPEHRCRRCRRCRRVWLLHADDHVRRPRRSGVEFSAGPGAKRKQRRQLAGA